jgi:hypothetical protein
LVNDIKYYYFVKYSQHLCVYVLLLAFSSCSIINFSFVMIFVVICLGHQYKRVYDFYNGSSTIGCGLRLLLKMSHPI